MTIPILGDAIHEVGETIRELIPDADKKMQVQLEFAKLADAAEARENALITGQLEINKAEAGSGNMFVAGWRPAIGWVSAVTLAYTWIVAPVCKSMLHLVELPIIPTDQIYPIVLAMLGVAGMRTVEKLQGVAASLPGNTPSQLPGQSQSSATEDLKQKTSVITKVGKWFK